MTTKTTMHAYLGHLGTQIATEGIAAGTPEVLALADAARVVAPGAAAALADPSLPEVLRLRAFAVASAALLRNPAIATAARTALTRTWVPASERQAAAAA